MAVSLLLHALGIGGLIAASLSAPKASRPAPVIELVAAHRPALPSPAPVLPPRAQSPAPERRTPPPAQRPQPAPPPPATFRDESALAQADTLAQPTAADTVPGALPAAPTRPAGPPGPPLGAGLGAVLKGDLVSVTRLTRMPVLTVARKPEYTAEMKRRNLAGKLKAKVLVDSDGKVKDAVVLTHLGYGTRESGLAALRKLEFDPGYADGAAVAVWIPFTFTFEWQE